MADRFAWYELMSNDPARSAAFYSAVVGWDVQPAVPGDSGGYQLFCPKDAPGKGVAGLIKLNEQMLANGARPGWIGYIHVDDVDAYAKRVVDAGGILKRPPSDVPNMLRLAVFTDPQGAPFILFKPDASMAGDGPPQPSSPATPGYIGWHELIAKDWQASWDFYAGLFGWEKDTAMDMGPMGTYQIMRPGTPQQMGAMMTGPAGSPAPFWNYYFTVDSIDAAIQRLTAAGGKVFMGPQEVPGPMWVVQGFDDQGAMFSLVSARP